MRCWQINTFKVKKIGGSVIDQCVFHNERVYEPLAYVKRMRTMCMFAVDLTNGQLTPNNNTPLLAQALSGEEAIAPSTHGSTILSHQKPKRPWNLCHLTLPLTKQPCYVLYNQHSAHMSSINHHHQQSPKI